MANAPMIAAGWRQPNRNVWMPSTNTDTVMPTHSARPSAASVSPASGASTDVSREEPCRHPHRGPADEREHPAARGPREAVAGGDEQRDRGGDDQAPHHPARRRRPAVEAEHLREVEVGPEREAERRLVGAACAYASGHGKSSTSAPIDATIAMPNAREHRPRAAGDRDGDDEREHREHEQPEPGGVERTEQRGRAPPSRSTRPRRGVAALAEAHDAQEQEREQREQHQRAEATLRDRVAGRRG